MIEITSPGNLPPSIDFSEMQSRQSDIRNRVIAPIFKHLGLIDQWGNGLKIIANELKSYQEIELKWFERGLQFQVQFIKKNYKPTLDQNIDLEELGSKIGSIFGLNWHQVSTKSAPSWHQVGTKLTPSWYQLEILLSTVAKSSTLIELLNTLGWKDKSKFRSKFIHPLLELHVIRMSLPDKPNSSQQKYLLTEKGVKFVTLLKSKLNQE